MIDAFGGSLEPAPIETIDIDQAQQDVGSLCAWTSQKGVASVNDSTTEASDNQMVLPCAPALPTMTTSSDGVAAKLRKQSAALKEK